MVKLNQQAFNQQSPPQTGFQTNQQSQFQSPEPNQSQFPEQPAQNQANQSKGLISLPPALLQVVPWIPFALEAISGQKIPQMGGTIAEIQASLQQIQFSLTQILNNQQQFWTKLESLETNASSQFTSLKEQVINTNNSFRLLATETKKSLEFHGNGSDFDKSRQFNPRPQPELTKAYEESNY